MANEVVFEGALTFRCPECDETVTVSGPDSEDRAIVHPLPMCARFKRVDTLRDAAEYMREARLKTHPGTVELNDVLDVLGADAQKKGPGRA